MLNAALVAAAVTLALVPIPAGLVERYYSTTVYPAVQRLVTPLSNLLPFALFDVAIGVAVVWLVIVFVRDMTRWRRAGVWRGLAVLARRVATLAAVLYLVFLFAWGLNYRRMPLVDKVLFDPSTANPARARDLALSAVQELNRLHDLGHADLAVGGALVQALETGFARTVRELGVVGTVPTARPKRSLIDPYFLAAGVDGMTDPYFLETLVSSGLLPVERPFVIAHEWSHLAGFADEGEANFVGWLAALRGGPAAQYSAWLFLYGQVVGSLDRGARDDVARRLAAGPLEDLRAIAARYQEQVLPIVSSAGWQVYDRYLKVNRVEAGIASYAEVVHLVLGTRFDTEWTPVMRAGADRQGARLPAPGALSRVDRLDRRPVRETTPTEER